MPDKLAEPISYQEYDDFVTSTRTDQIGSDWQATYANYTQAETLELINQHGPCTLLMLPTQYGDIVEEMYPDSKLRDRMIAGATDELSDMIWFSVATAQLLGVSMLSSCEVALTKHTGTAIELNDFDPLDAAVMQAAGDLRVANAFTLYGYEASSELATTSVEQNPYYFFMRTSARLVRALDGRERGPMPPTLTDVESKEEPVVALGELVCGLSYVAQNRFETTTAQVAGYNKQKLEHRAVHGKKKDDSASIWEEIEPYL